MDSLAEVWATIHDPLGGAMCLAGAVLCIIGTVGALRFPDFYTRLHATSVTDTGGATLMLAGMLVLAPGPFIAVKVFFVWLLLFLTSPTASHAVANAAHKAGLEPIIGPVSGEQGGEAENG